MNDGLDGRETIAFGLGAPEVAALVLALVTAYAVLRSGLAAALAWVLATLVAGTGALLAWGRLAGRPMLEWAMLLAAFVVRTAPGRAVRARQRLAAAAARLREAPAEAGRCALAPLVVASSAQAGAVVIPLALRRLSPITPPQLPVPMDASGRRSHVVGFFSLAGGTGRTTLAVEVAAILAVRGRTAAATGARGGRVLLLDLARRNPAVAVRLGVAPSPGSAASLLIHATGLLVAPAATATLPPGEAPPFPLALVATAGADVVIVDFDADLSGSCEETVSRCDELLVTTTPTAAGVLSAYRSTAVLRRLGARARISHVVNRSRPGVDLGEVMADLGGDPVAVIPDSPWFVSAEDGHRLVGLDTDGDPAAALQRLATCVEERAGMTPAGWGRHAG